MTAEIGVLTPLTAVVTIRRLHPREPSVPVRRMISRTTERLHLTLPAQREWLFERNPTDGRRVAACFTDHAARTIVIYEEAELRDLEGVSSWGDVVTLGFDVGLFHLLQPTGQVRARAGLQFVRWVPSGAAETPLTEVWWNAREALPISLTRSCGASTIRQTCEELELSADPLLLRSPMQRFPGYRVTDVAAWIDR